MALCEYLIPAYMHSGFSLYYFRGISPGGFLTSVLEGDLFGAVASADSTNIRCLDRYAQFIFHHMPGAAIRNNVSAWIAGGGLGGQQRATK